MTKPSSTRSLNRHEQRATDLLDTLATAWARRWHADMWIGLSRQRVPHEPHLAMLRRKSQLPGDDPKVLQEIVTVLEVEFECWKVLCWDPRVGAAYVAEISPRPPAEAARRYAAIGRDMAGVKQVQLWVGDGGQYGCDVQLAYAGTPVLRWHEAKRVLTWREPPNWTPEVGAQYVEDKTHERLVASLLPWDEALGTPALT